MSAVQGAADALLPLGHRADVRLHRRIAVALWNLRIAAAQQQWLPAVAALAGCFTRHPLRPRQPNLDGQVYEARRKGGTFELADAIPPCSATASARPAGIALSKPLG